MQGWRLRRSYGLGRVRRRTVARWNRMHAWKCNLGDNGGMLRVGGSTWQYRKWNRNSKPYGSARIRGVRWEPRSSSRGLKTRCSGSWLGKREVVLQNHMQMKGRSPWCYSTTGLGNLPFPPRFPDGEVVRTAPKTDGYRPRIGPDGSRTDSHNTGERVQ